MWLLSKRQRWRHFLLMWKELSIHFILLEEGPKPLFGKWLTKALWLLKHLNLYLQRVQRLAVWGICLWSYFILLTSWEISTWFGLIVCSFILYIVIILKNTELLLNVLTRRILLYSFLKEKYMCLLDFLVQNR